MKIRKSGIKCVACGKDGAYWQCGIYKKAMHWSDPITASKKKEEKGKHQHQQLITYALDYHNEYIFGLTKDDTALVVINKKEWCMPTDQMREDNANHIRRLTMQYIKKNWTVNNALAQETEVEGDADETTKESVVEEGKAEEYIIDISKSLCFILLVSRRLDGVVMLWCDLAVEVHRNHYLST